MAETQPNQSELMGRFLNSGYLGTRAFIKSPVRLVAGFGATVFHLATTVLGEIKGCFAPSPDGESRALPTNRPRFLLIPFATAIFCLVAATLLDSFASKADGIVTDAVIDTYHNRRLPFYRLNFVSQV